MIADLNNIPDVFRDFNRKHFGGSLPTPGFEVMSRLDIFARFECRREKYKGHPIRYPKILFSDCYEYTEEDFRNLMVHEMIHYYMMWNGIKDNKSHGKQFMKIANDMNQKYGLNITKHANSSSFKRTDRTPQRTGILRFLFG